MSASRLCNQTASALPAKSCSADLPQSQAILGSARKAAFHGRARHRCIRKPGDSAHTMRCVDGSVSRRRVDEGAILQIVSLANPWLDFLEPAEAVNAARQINAELEAFCSPPASTLSDGAASVASTSREFVPLTQNRLFAFGTLPLVPGVEIDAVLEAIAQIEQADHLRGVVMGTKGLGKGIDDLAMEPVYEALSAAGLVVFVVSTPVHARLVCSYRTLTRRGGPAAPTLRDRECLWRARQWTRARARSRLPLRDYHREELSASSLCSTWY